MQEKTGVEISLEYDPLQDSGLSIITHINIILMSKVIVRSTFYDFATFQDQLAKKANIKI